MKLKEECFICFEEDGILFSPGCLCKTMKVHESCLIQLRTIKNSCSVCKEPFNINPRRHYFHICFECGEVEFLHKIVPFVLLIIMYTLLLITSFKDNQYFFNLICIWVVICISSFFLICDCHIPLL